MQARSAKYERERSLLVAEAAQLRERIESSEERERSLEEKHTADSDAMQERLRDKQLELERTRLDLERLKVRIHLIKLDEQPFVLILYTILYMYS